ncbi:MAG: hypothetical protein JW809_16545 [Pirellulales bacterium]|nr:hypothetical protein [Pirellulales bacterium]
MNDADRGTTPLSPTEALRLIRAVLCDGGMSAGERIAAAAVILNADHRTGLAWASYRGICDGCHVRPGAVAAALRAPGQADSESPDKPPKPAGKAIGVYLDVHERGRHGSVCYAILRQECSAETALPTRKRSKRPALPEMGPSASRNGVQRFRGGRHSYPSTAPHTLAPSNTVGPVATARWTNAQVERVYAAYPRKVGRAAAIKAIRRALDELARRADSPADPVAWLADRVRAYAATRAGQDPQFTPHPRTWFSQGRFDDAPEPNHTGVNGDGQPAKLFRRVAAGRPDLADPTRYL